MSSPSVGFRASLAQEWAILNSRTNPAAPPLQANVCFRIDGVLDIDGLRCAVGEVLRVHPQLRSWFRIAGEDVMCKVVPESASLLRRVFRVVREEDLREPVVDFLRATAHEPFDRLTGPLIRVTVVHSRSAFASWILVAIDHLVCDGRTIEIVLSDLTAAYEGRGALLPERDGYPTFAEEQRHALAGDVGRAILAYWRATLGDSPEILRLQMPGYVEALPSGPGSLEITIDPKTHRGLTSLARATRTTLNSVVLAGVLTWIHSQTGQGSMTLVTSVANRTDLRFERTAGWFANSVFPTFSWHGDRVADLVAYVQRTMADAVDHALAPSWFVRQELWGRAASGFRTIPSLYSVVNRPWGLLSLGQAPVQEIVLDDRADAPGIQLWFQSHTERLDLQVLFQESNYPRRSIEDLVDALLGDLRRITTLSLEAGR